MKDITIDPELDLVIDRIVPTRRADVWKAWTTPELLKQWFAPKPWTVKTYEADFVPGGGSYLVMSSPEGEDYPYHGCVLEVVEGERLVHTDTMTAGFRPQENPFMCVIMEIEDAPDGTRYRVIARHLSPDARAQHEEMGFHSGWNQCIDQLVELFPS